MQGVEWFGWHGSAAGRAAAPPISSSSLCVHRELPSPPLCVCMPLTLCVLHFPPKFQRCVYGSISHCKLSLALVGDRRPRVGVGVRKPWTHKRESAAGTNIEKSRPIKTQWQPALIHWGWITSSQSVCEFIWDRQINLEPGANVEFCWVISNCFTQACKDPALWDHGAVILWTNELVFIVWKKVVFWSNKSISI